jgi:hypothetical protein
MIIVGRHAEGITLNPLEYLLDGEDGEIMKFKDIDEAKAFLKSKGFTEDDMYWLTFEEEEE